MATEYCGRLGIISATRAPRSRPRCCSHAPRSCDSRSRSANVRRSPMQAHASRLAYWRNAPSSTSTNVICASICTSAGTPAGYSATHGRAWLVAVLSATVLSITDAEGRAGVAATGVVLAARLGSARPENNVAASDRSRLPMSPRNSSAPRMPRKVSKPDSRNVCKALMPASRAGPRIMRRLCRSKGFRVSASSAWPTCTSSAICRSRPGASPHCCHARAYRAASTVPVVDSSPHLAVKLLA